MIRDRVLVGCKSTEVQKKLLEDSSLTLKRAIEIARSHEASKTQMQEISQDSSSVDRVSKGGKPRPKFSRGNKKNFDKSREQKSTCTRCERDRHENREDCPALKEKCHFCGHTVHYKDFCFKQQRQSKSKVRHMYYEDDDVPILGSVSTECEINSVDSWHAELLVNSQENVLSYRHGC